MSANVLELPAMRRTFTPKTVSSSTRSARPGEKARAGADLLSIRQHLNFKASVSIVDLAFVESVYSAQVADKLVTHIRTLLDTEFGPLRVHRRRQAFVISHHCMESLMAGLLRVQFHSCQIPLPVSRDADGLSDKCGVPLCWGVGKTFTEAESHRNRKQNV